jgi:hypothetical protein
MAVPDLNPLSLAQLRALLQQAAQQFSDANELRTAVNAEIEQRQRSARVKMKFDQLTIQEKEALLFQLKQELFP